MISAILYTSNSGFTAEYAKMLAQATGLPCNDLSQMHSPQPQEEVIYFGWVMAGRCMGVQKAMALCNVRAVIKVGMAPGSQAACDALREKANIPADVKIFTLQGGFDMDRLHGPMKWIMKFKCKQIKEMLEEKGELNETQQLTYDMATKGASAVSMENLQPVLDWYNENK